MVAWGLVVWPGAAAGAGVAGLGLLLVPVLPVWGCCWRRCCRSGAAAGGGVAGSRPVAGAAGLTAGGAALRAGSLARRCCWCRCGRPGAAADGGVVSLGVASGGGVGVVLAASVALLRGCGFGGPRVAGPTGLCAVGAAGSSQAGAALAARSARVRLTCGRLPACAGFRRGEGARQRRGSRAAAAGLRPAGAAKSLARPRQFLRPCRGKPAPPPGQTCAPAGANLRPRWSKPAPPPGQTCAPLGANLAPPRSARSPPAGAGLLPGPAGPPGVPPGGGVSGRNRGRCGVAAGVRRAGFLVPPAFPAGG
ncbi:hypothetical protein EDD35_5129 [Amycolatopsis thermoflava]|uniref:Uncharacterized protein n=1 Tax=Amycolatopsis thermoflava TaxID=84480 RepID=A0A3N2H1D8_9PSEU|nr:hypothetical protein EDD35_5129 [Amycolatopsis thermoflava]